TFCVTSCSNTASFIWREADRPVAEFSSASLSSFILSRPCFWLSTWATAKGLLRDSWLARSLFLRARSNGEKALGSRLCCRAAGSLGSSRPYIWYTWSRSIPGAEWPIRWQVSGAKLNCDTRSSMVISAVTKSIGAKVTAMSTSPSAGIEPLSGSTQHEARSLILQNASGCSLMVRADGLSIGRVRISTQLGGESLTYQNAHWTAKPGTNRSRFSYPTASQEVGCEIGHLVRRANFTLLLRRAGKVRWVNGVAAHLVDLSECGACMMSNKDQRRAKTPRLYSRNILSFRILGYNKSRRNQSSTFYLRALAVADSGALILNSLLMAQMMMLRPAIHLHPLSLLSIMLNSYPMCNVRMYLSRSTTLIAVYIIVLFSIERALVVINPFRWMRFFTLRKAKLAVIGLTLISYSICIPAMFSFNKESFNYPKRLYNVTTNKTIVAPTLLAMADCSRLRREGVNGTGSLVMEEPMPMLGILAQLALNKESIRIEGNLSTVHRMLLNQSKQERGLMRHIGLECQSIAECRINFPIFKPFIMFYNISISLIPFIITGVCNLIILVSLRNVETKNLRKSKPNEEVQDRQVTKKLIIVSTAFVVLSFPLALFHLITGIMRGSYCSTFWSNYLTIGLTLSSSNHAVNFIIYCISEEQFRRLVVSVLMCKRHRLTRLLSYINEPRNRGACGGGRAGGYGAKGRSRRGNVGTTNTGPATATTGTGCRKMSTPYTNITNYSTSQSQSQCPDQSELSVTDVLVHQPVERTPSATAAAVNATARASASGDVKDERIAPATSKDALICEATQSQTALVRDDWASELFADDVEDRLLDRLGSGAGDPIQWLRPNLGMRVWLANLQAVVLLNSEGPAGPAGRSQPTDSTVAKEGPAGSAGRSDQSYQTQNTQRPASSAGGSKGTASSEPKGPAKSGRSDEAQRARLERKRAKQRAKRQAKKGAAGAKAAASTMDAEATGVPRQPDGPAGGSSGSSAAALPGDAAAAAEAETTAQQMATANKEVPSGATFAAKAKAKIPGVIIQGRDQDWTTDQLQKVWSAVDSYLIELTVEEGISIGIERMVLRSTFVLIAPSSEEDARQLLQRLPTVSLDADLGGALFLREGQRPKTIPYVVFVPAKSTAAGPDVIRRVLLRLNPDLPASGLVYHRKVRRGETGNSIVLGLSSTWASRYPNGSSFQLGALKLKMRRGKSAKGKATANPGISGKSGAQSKAQGKAQADPKAKAASRPSASSSSATAVTAPAKPREPNLPVGEGVEDEAGSSESELSSATLHCVSASVNLMKIAELYRPGLILIQEPWMRNGKLPNIPSGYSDFYELTDLRPIETCEDVDHMAETLTGCIIEAYEAACPARAYKGKTSAPWWNPELGKLRRKAKSLHRRAMKTGNPEDMELFRQASRNFKSEVRKAKEFGYADDVTAIVAGPSPSTLRDLMQSFIRKAESWANDNGLELSEPKTVAIMFTSRLRWNIRPLQLYGRDIAFAHQTRCLGVILDHRLNWSSHVKAKAKRASAILAQLRRALGTSWDLLNTIQGRACRLICNATRSTPFAGMGAFLNLPPLDLFIRGEAARTTRRLIDAGVKFIYMRAPAKRNLVPHSDLCLNFLNECQANRVFTDGIASTLNLRQRYSVAIDSRDNINDHWNPGELHCYTDGSKQSANTGFGVGIFLNGRVIATHAQYTGVNSSVFQNEVLAISSCTAELLATGVTAWIRTQHRSTWANRTNCRQSRGAVPQPSHQLRKLLLRLSRRDIRAATMTLSGHGCFSRHQYLQGNATNATCSFCNSGDETAEHFVEMGMKNHEFVPDKLAKAISGLRCSDSGVLKICRDLCQRRLLSHVDAGYRLTVAGYDCLALKALVNSGKLTGIGSQIGVGKESDVYLACDADGGEVCVKLHRLGRTSFRQLKNKRDYIGARRHFNWLYVSRLSAEREFAFLQALHSEGLPVPKPHGHNRHAVVMEFVTNASPLNSVSSDHPDAESLYLQCRAGLERLAELGLVHGDYNEFNLLVQEPSDKGPDGKPLVRIIDLPQCISRRHPQAVEQYNRDAGCLVTFFLRKFEQLRHGWLQEREPTRLSDIARDARGVRLDEKLKASGYRAGDVVAEEEEDSNEDSDSTANEDFDEAAKAKEAGATANSDADKPGEEGEDKDEDVSDSDADSNSEESGESAEDSEAAGAVGAAGAKSTGKSSRRSKPPDDPSTARRRVRAERQREMRRAGLRAGRRAAKRERTARDRRDMHEELTTWG
uniref:non-specific serine/threonine protein kinase n=1 Tax=Macrostomum lignano TaxID=282301 RepID=A0A1I8I441_9PLAT